LEPLTKETLIQILSDVRNSLSAQYRYLFSLDNVSLSFANESLIEIAERTIKTNTGARGLQSELERILLPHMFNIKKYNRDGIKVLEITPELVNNPAAL
jgi:ATP-dependent Clp protease ATP-binding subunit ClpX